MRFSGASLAEAIGLCTVNPARLLSLGGQTGILAVGEPADLALFRLGNAGEKLSIERTVIAGEEAFTAES